MSLRPFNFPKDFQVCTEIADASFQYPDHPEWEFTAAERKTIIGEINTIAKWWPLLRVFRYVSPRINDLFYGYVWQEGSESVGFVTCYRRTPERWEVGWLAVLPQYRQRGIGRKLLQGALDLMRQRKGKLVNLGMLKDNLPAYKLYEQIGFVKYAESISHRYLASTPLPEKGDIPAGYTLSILDSLERGPIYELARRITPPSVAKYEPVEPGRYRTSLSEKIFHRLIDKFSGTVMRQFALYADKEIVAYGRYDARLRSGGISYISLRADPTHPKAAAYLLHYLLGAVLELGPDNDIEFSLAEWQEAELKAAQELGCKELPSKYISLGLELGV